MDHSSSIKSTTVRKHPAFENLSAWIIGTRPNPQQFEKQKSIISESYRKCMTGIHIGQV